MRQPSRLKRLAARVVAVTAGVAGSSLMAVMAVTDAALHRSHPGRPDGTPRH